MHRAFLPATRFAALGLALWTGGAATAQSFSIEAFQALPDGTLRLQAPASDSTYLVLLQGSSLEAVNRPVGAALGREVIHRTGEATAFFRLQRVPLASPLDLDHDGITDVFELQHPSILNPLDDTDALLDSDDDGDSNLAEFQRGSDPESGGLTRLKSSSPRSGERGVAVTRETILRFTRPLAADTVLSTGNFYAMAAGRRILTRGELSSDRRKATLFYLENLPANTRVQVSLLGGGIRDGLNQRVDLDGDGVEGGDARIEFATLETAALTGTAVSGRVFASEPIAGAPGATNFLNKPLAGVTVTVDGAEESLRTTTDDEGRFLLNPCPPGRFFVHVDGRTAQGSDWPSGAYYPVVGKAWEAVAGTTNTLPGGTGEIFLPLIRAGTLTETSSTDSTLVKFPPEVLLSNPGLSGVEVIVPPNALFSENGARGGRVGIAPVPSDRLPEPLPPGLNLPLVITVQTDGPQNFDRPVPVRFPNLPDPETGKALPPGAKTGLWSFNHDTGRWELQGRMTISADGKFAESDPGVGILQPGWHGTGPGTQGNDDDDGDGDDQPCKKELANFESATAQFYIGAYLGLIELSPGFGCVLSVAQGWAGFTFDCNRDFDNCTAYNAYLFALGSAIGCVPFVGGAASLWFSVVTAVQPAADALEQCMKDHSQAALHAPVTIPEGVLNEQAALWKATADVFTVFAGSDKWVNCPVEETPLWDDFFKAMQQASDPGSTDGILLGAGERASLLAMPLPRNLTAADATQLVNRVAGMLDGSLRLTRAEVDALGAASTNLLEVARELESRGWQTTADFVSRGVTGSGVALPVASSVAAARSGSAARPAANDPAHPDTYEPIIETVHYRLADLVRGTSQSGKAQTLDGRLPQVVLAADTVYVVDYYNVTRQRVATTVFRSGAAGTSTEMPTGRKMPIFGDAVRGFPPQPDEDGDGLPTIAERVIGTDPSRADTDDDGVSDLSEFYAGTNPIGEQAATTGAQGGTDTPGTALGIAVASDLAVVADGAAGISVFQVPVGSPPTLLAQLDTPGTAQAVAMGEGLAVVADGVFGLAIVDLSDPAFPQLRRQVVLGGGATASAVALADGVAYVAAGTRGLFVVDVASGEVLTTVAGIGDVDDVFADHERLYILTEKELRIHRPAVLGLDLLGTLPVAGGVAPGESGRHLTVCRQYAYVGFSAGYRVVDVSNPAAPVLLGEPGVAQPGVFDLVHDGNRLLAQAGIVNGLSAVYLYDASVPTNTTQFIASFNVTGGARSLAWHRGRLLVAASFAGLQVVQPLAPDTARKAPVFSDVTLVDDADPAAPGVQAVLNSVVRPRFDVRDDRHVASVELLVNGLVVDTATGCPFELAAFLRPSAKGGTQATVQLRARDAAGNTAVTSVLPVDLIPGSTAPSLVLSTPAAGSSGVAPGSIRLVFDRPISDLSGATLVNLGADGLPGGGDDAAVSGWGVHLELGNRVLVFDLQDVLPVGAFQVGLGAAVSRFAVVEDSLVARWTSNADGNWSDPSNWSGGTVPSASSYVVIDRPGFSPLVSLAGNVTLKGIRSTARLSLVDSSLTVTGTGASALLGEVQMLRSTLAVQGKGALLSANGLQSMTSSSLSAVDGARLIAPALTNWAPEGIQGAELAARGFRSQLELPALKNAAGPLGDFLFGGLSSLNFIADQGGSVSAPVLGPNLTGEVILRAVRGGTVSAPKVRSLVTGPADSQFRSELEVSGGGILILDRLARTVGVNVHRGVDSVLDVTALAEAANSSFSFDSGLAEFSQLAEATGLSVRANGAQVSLPALARHTGPGQWFAAGTGASLSFPVLQTLSGPPGGNPDNLLSVECSVDGVVEFPALKEMSGRVRLLASGDSRRSNGRIVASQLARVTGNPVGPGRFTCDNFSALDLPALVEASHVEWYFQRFAMPNVPQLKSLVGGTLITATRATPDLSQFTTLTDVSLDAQLLSELRIPATTEVQLDGTRTPPGAVGEAGSVVWSARDQGRIVIESRPAGIVDAGPAHAHLSLHAESAGVIDLSGIASIPAGEFAITTIGNEGVIDLSGLAVLEGSGLIALAEGQQGGGLTFPGGTLRLNSAAVVLRGLELRLAPLSTVSVGTLRVEGSLTGNGTLAGAVVNAGVVRPGVDETTPGRIEVQGTYVQEAGGRLAVLVHDGVPGTGHGQLVTTGTATLAGRLEVDGRSRTGGVQYEVLTASGLNGKFGEVDLKFPAFAPVLDYGADAVVVRLP